MILINKKPIAILLAVYNGEKYLAEQIDSVITQTNQDWTLYIRDDNSNDNTCKIIEQYCQKYDNIISVKDGKGNLGCSGNFYRLLEVVESDYYMFCDGDDVWLPRKIEMSLNRIKELEQIHLNKPVLVHTDKVVVNEYLEVKAASHWKSINLNPDKLTTYNYMGVCSFVGGATTIFNKTSKFYVFPIPQVDHLYDVWISLQIVKYGFIEAIKEPLILYRQHEANVCGVTIKTDTEYSIKSKIKNIKNITNNCIRLAKMRRDIGWGPIPKYLLYKIVVFVKLRLEY